MTLTGIGAGSGCGGAGGNGAAGERVAAGAACSPPTSARIRTTMSPPIVVGGASGACSVAPACRLPLAD